jgi:hypothetical protein
LKIFNRSTIEFISTFLGKFDFPPTIPEARETMLNHIIEFVRKITGGEGKGEGIFIPCKSVWALIQGSDVSEISTKFQEFQINFSFPSLTAVPAGDFVENSLREIDLARSLVVTHCFDVKRYVANLSNSNSNLVKVPGPVQKKMRKFLENSLLERIKSILNEGLEITSKKVILVYLIFCFENLQREKLWELINFNWPIIYYLYPILLYLFLDVMLVYRQVNHRTLSWVLGLPEK